MAKTKWAVASRRRRKRLLQQTKGFRGSRGKRLRTASETLRRALAYRTRDRRVKKRTFRNLWVIRLNAAARERGIPYGQLMAACRKAKIQLNRKQLSELAIHDGKTLDKIVAVATAK